MKTSRRRPDRRRHEIRIDRRAHVLGHDFDQSRPWQRASMLPAQHILPLDRAGQGGGRPRGRSYSAPDRAPSAAPDGSPACRSCCCANRSSAAYRRQIFGKVRRLKFRDRRFRVNRLSEKLVSAPHPPRQQAAAKRTIGQHRKVVRAGHKETRRPRSHARTDYTAAERHGAALPRGKHPSAPVKNCSRRSREFFLPAIARPLRRRSPRSVCSDRANGSGRDRSRRCAAGCSKSSISFMTRARLPLRNGCSPFQSSATLVARTTPARRPPSAKALPTISSERPKP